MHVKGYVSDFSLYCALFIFRFRLSNQTCHLGSRKRCLSFFSLILNFWTDAAVQGSPTLFMAILKISRNSQGYFCYEVLPYLNPLNFLVFHPGILVHSKETFLQWIAWWVLRSFFCSFSRAFGFKSTAKYPDHQKTKWACFWFAGLIVARGVGLWLLGLNCD